jgi:hypothetical protein
MKIRVLKNVTACGLSKSTDIAEEHNAFKSGLNSPELLFVTISLPTEHNNAKDSNLIILNSVYSEELYALCSSPNIVRVIKSRRMRWEGHAVFSRK